MTQQRYDRKKRRSVQETEKGWTGLFVADATGVTPDILNLLPKGKGEQED